VGSLRGRLAKLEQEAGEFYETLRLPDGTEVRYETSELLDALCAAIDGSEHRLLLYFRQMDTTQGMPGIIRAIEGSSQHAS
jgi:hypothetical protein